MPTDSASVFDDWEFLAVVQEEVELALGTLKSSDEVGSKSRASSVTEMVRKKEHWPAPWQQLSLGVNTDDILTSCIVAVTHQMRQDLVGVETILESVRNSLVLVCIRNAGRWYQRGDRSKSWRGFLIAHIRALVTRAARREIAAISTDEISLAAGVRRPEDLVFDFETNELLRAAVEELSAEERLLVTLRFVETLKISEIASICKMKYSTATDRINRALDKLRKLMGPIE